MRGVTGSKCSLSVLNACVLVHVLPHANTTFFFLCMCQMVLLACAIGSDYEYYTF